MLVKCNFLSKLHLCTTQGRWANVGVSWTDQLTEAILYSIPEGPWPVENSIHKMVHAGHEERQFIDDEIILKREKFELYLPLKRAMARWEEVQDTKGAPGFEPGWYGFTCDSNLEEALANMVKTVNAIIDGIARTKKSAFLEHSDV